MGRGSEHGAGVYLYWGRHHDLHGGAARRVCTKRIVFLHRGNAGLEHRIGSRYQDSNHAQPACG
jgi:hypothetical protein